MCPLIDYRDIGNLTWADIPETDYAPPAIELPLRPEDRLALKREEIARRYAQKLQRAREGALTRTRLNSICFVEVQRLARYRFGSDVLPDTEMGRAFLFVLYALRVQKPGGVGNWSAEERAPWLKKGTRKLLEDAVRERTWKWKAATLGKKLQVTHAERETLRLTQMQSIDGPKPKTLRKQKARARDARRRAGRGQRARAQSASRTRPWEALSISRRTWERRGKPTQDAKPTGGKIAVRAATAVTQIAAHPIENTGAREIASNPLAVRAEPRASPLQPTREPRRLSLEEHNELRRASGAPPLGAIARRALGKMEG